MISKNTAYLSKLDHLRFLAALMVAAFHFHGGPALQSTYNPVLALIKEGQIGVSLFMVLSGFILATISFGKEIDYKAFVYNRFVRIYPLYFLMIMVAVFAAGRSVDFISLLTLLSPFGNVGSVMGGIKFPHLWTIAVELQFYLIFPFIMTFTSRYGLKYLVGVIIAAILIRAVMFVNFGSVQDGAYSTIVGRIDQFCVGMIAAILYKNGKTFFSSPFALLATAALLYGWVQLFAVWTQGGFYGLDSTNNKVWVIAPALEGLVFALLVLAYLQQKWEFPKIIDKCLSYCGGISFSMYAWHLPLVSYFGHVHPEYFRSGWGWYFVFIVLPTMIAVSSLSYFLIEKPFFSFRTSYLKKNPPQKEASLDNVIRAAEAAKQD